MQLYATQPTRRIRQVTADVLAVLGVVVAVLLGVAVHGSIAALGDVGRRVATTGGSFRDALRSAAGKVAEIPFGGRAASAPLRSASSAAADLASAGQAQQAAVAHTALLVGLVVAGIPVVVIVGAWLRRRVGFVRQSGAIARLARTPAGPELLAARGLMLADAREGRDLPGDIADRWRRGDPAAVRMLAGIALRHAGVSPSILPPSPARSTGPER